MEKMKLAAIVNHWVDCEDLLPFFIHNASQWADGIIIIVSDKSNTGEVHYVGLKADIWQKVVNQKLTWLRWSPDLSKDQRYNETKKRNYGLSVAHAMGFTHFVTCDTDEIYSPEDVNRIKEMFDSPTLNGLVVPCQTYFGHPWLTIGFDTTLVPFIHKLNPDTRHEFNRKYPFAWIDGKIRIDPTRSLNYTSGIIHTESVVMHHYSWIRSDYKLKIRNSTARANIERSTILTDLGNAKEGYFCQFYGKTLVRTDVDFGIPDLSARNATENLQSLNEAEDKPGAS
jgi:hypothetical protein